MRILTFWRGMRYAIHRWVLLSVFGLGLLSTFFPASAQQAAGPRLRGVRVFLHNEDLERDWYYSREYWDEYFAMLAHNRFNRFNLVFAHQTNYLAPPYPHWIVLPEFPRIRVPGLSDEQRERNLQMLRYISDTAAAHGIDFTLGIWQHDVQAYQTPTVEGLTPDNIGPYSRAALATILELCPAIRSVQLRTNTESGIPVDRQLPFYRDYIFPAIKRANRILDLRAWAVAGGMLDAVRDTGVTTRVSTKYWAEDLGRPYQPAETYPGYSYLNLLEKPRPYDFYWEVWALGSNRILLWGNPEYVRRAVPTFGLSQSIGFEIDAPPTQKGYGNQPGTWDVFTSAQRGRKFWKWDFERYWMFYLLWGRIGENPAVADTMWTDELQQRFGSAWPDVLDAYRESSRVINEIVAAHLADPNMYIWPEINPGGLIDAYEEVLPSDWRYIAAPAQTVRDLLAGTASAKQTAFDTANLLDGIADRIDAAVRRASARLGRSNREWEGSYPDFNVLAILARYHANKQRAALNLAWFDATGDPEALATAKQQLTSGGSEWERLVSFTDGLYSDRMANGPDDQGHWKDKLPYVRYDLERVREREDIMNRFGTFDYGFDFGGPIASGSGYRNIPFVRANTVEPRFHAVASDTTFDEKTGYGWARQGRREAAVLPLTPYLEVQAGARDPHHLPRDVLFGDYIHGDGDQIFVVRTPDDDYEVLFLGPDRSVRREMVRATEGRLQIRFPRGNWSVSGLIVKRQRARVQPSHLHVPSRPPRPVMTHQPPAIAEAGKPLQLTLQIEGGATALVRLHYRAVNQMEQFRTLEGNGSFTIPGGDISARWDLMYYFEVLAPNGSGWFYPDPAVATPYFVITTR